MFNEQATTSSLKGHIESAEEHALGSEKHAQLEVTENVVHRYIPAPLEISFIVITLIGLAIFIISRLR